MPTPSSTFLKKALIILSLTTVGCVASIEPVVQVPPVVIASSNSHFGASGTMLSSINFTDVRVSDEVVSPGFVSPEGDVSGTLRKSVLAALQDRGVQFSASAAKRIEGKVKIWEAHFEGSGAVSLRSEAAIEVSVWKGKYRTFGGTYNGVRSSQFPLVTAQDVQDSLSLSMEHAISHMLKDEKLQRAISK